jgi:hypothetical protein
MIPNRKEDYIPETRELIHPAVLPPLGGIPQTRETKSREIAIKVDCK